MFTEVVLRLASQMMVSGIAARLSAAKRIQIAGQSVEGLSYVQEHGIESLEEISLQGLVLAVEDDDGVAFIWDYGPATTGWRAPRRYWVCARAGASGALLPNEFVHITGIFEVTAVRPHDPAPFEGQITVERWFHTTDHFVIDSGPDPGDPSFNDCPWRLSVRALLLLALPKNRCASSGPATSRKGLP